jgi:hypothetical protein
VASRATETSVAIQRPTRRYIPDVSTLLFGSKWSASVLVKRPRYPLERRLDVPQSRSEHCGVEKIALSLSGIESQPSSP